MDGDKSFKTRTVLLERFDSRMISMEFNHMPQKLELGCSFFKIINNERKEKICLFLERKVNKNTHQ